MLSYPVEGQVFPNVVTKWTAWKQRQLQYHVTENDYIIDSETIMDVNNYIPFSTINSQAIDEM